MSLPFAPEKSTASREETELITTRQQHFFCERRYRRRGTNKLFCFGRVRKRRGRRRATAHNLRDKVEVTCPNEALMLHGLIAVLSFALEFCLLQLRVGGHSAQFVFARQLEHAQVERVKPCQRDELELVSHLGEGFPETSDGGLVQLLFPVERG